MEFSIIFSPKFLRVGIYREFVGYISMLKTRTASLTQGSQCCGETLPLFSHAFQRALDIPFNRILLKDKGLSNVHPFSLILMAMFTNFPYFYVCVCVCCVVSENGHVYGGVHAQMCVHVCACVCIWKPEADNGDLP